MIAKVKKIADDEISVKASFRDLAEISELKEDIQYKVTFTEVGSKRTLAQNNLMWKLIHEIGHVRGGERANDDMEIYAEVLERAGISYEVIAAVPEAENELIKRFRAIQRLNCIVMDGRVFYTYKVFIGSSRLNTKEMSLLLETTMDIAEECGIETGRWIE